MMVLTVNIPNIGEDILEVTEILVKVGDNININQPLLVIEGDKSSMEVPSPSSGIITKIHTHIGDKIHTGSIILSIDSNNKIPDRPPLHHITKKFNPSQKDKSEYDADQNNTQYYNKKSHTNFLVHATPFIRQIARNFEIDLSKIKGSGRKGRILKEDIQNYLSTLPQHIYDNKKTIVSHKTHSPTTVRTQHLERNFKKFGDIEIISLNKIQKFSGAHLQRNWATIPHVTQFDVVDVTNLEKFRKQQNLEIQKKKMNYKITVLTFIIKAVAKALEEFPRFNSSLSHDHHSLILKKYINIGIAVDTKKGLLVPVLKDVNKKGILQLSKELSEISQKARSNNQLHPLDIQGGSFTVSNLGGIGGGAFTPIINSTEVAILGISKSSIEPIWTGKKFIPRLMLPLSLSYDHRVIDGADGAKFIHFINKTIADIRLLSM